MNYNAVLKYIIENLSDYREEIESTLSYIYKYRMSFQQADRGGKLEDTIMSAISDYEVDNDYEQDEILDQLLSEYDLEDIFFDAIDKINNRNNESINETNDETFFDDYEINDYSDNYWDNIHELKAQQEDFYRDLKYLRIQRDELMQDMENDPAVINDLDGDAAQEYGKQLGEIDDKIEEIKNKIKKIQLELRELESYVNEAYETHDWKHFDNDDRRYEAYVLIDESDGSIIYNYQVWAGDFWLDILNDAIEDARKEQRHNKYGSYGVYGCINNEYDESTRVFITNGLNESKISKSDKQILESLVSKYGKSGVNIAISRLYEEDIETSNYIDDNGNLHMVWQDEDTGEMMDIILDSNDDLQLTPSDDMNFHVDVGDYNYNKSFETLEDALEYIKNGKFAKDKFLYIYDNDYNYYDPETGEIENSDDDLGFKISDRLIDLQNELKDYKQRRKLLMSDMENDPDVINDLDGEAAQEYGAQLEEIDERIEELEDQIRNLKRE